VIRVADNDVAHQGSEAITRVLAKEKYLLYDENGEPLDLRTKVDEYVQDCSDCSERVPEPDELLNIPKALEEKVFLFADRKHKGFAEAYSRVKSWAVFPDFKRKIQHHTARCLECGKRTAQLLLSPKHREAISRRHHLKVILR